MYTPSTEDILRSLGLSRFSAVPQQSSMPDWVTPVAVFGAGVVVGAATALLAAPKSGRELRSDIAQKAIEARDAVSERIPDMSTVSPFSNSKSNAAIEAK